jgi:hypothetical protein
MKGPHVDPEPSPLPVNEPKWTVTQIQPVGAALWAYTLVGPDGEKHTVCLADGSLSMKTVRLSATVVALLWDVKRGATPYAKL